MIYDNKYDIIDGITATIMCNNKHLNIEPMEDKIKKTVKIELDKIGCVKSLRWLMYTKKDLYKNVTNKLYWVFEIYR